MRLRGRGRREIPLEVAAGERLLAWAADDDRTTVIGGSRDAVYLRRGDEPVRRVPWEQVEAAEWDAETGVLRLSEVGTFGEQQPDHALGVVAPDRLLQLVRERVTASVVLQRHVPITGSRGVRVIARRAPGRHDEVFWVYQYDVGIDPAEPAVRLAAAEALEAARGEVGLR